MYRNSKKLRDFVKEFDLSYNYLPIKNCNAKQSYIKEIKLFRSVCIHNKVIHLPFIYKKLPIIWEYNIDEQ